LSGAVQNHSVAQWDTRASAHKEIADAMIDTTFEWKHTLAIKARRTFPSGTDKTRKLGNAKARLKRIELIELIGKVLHGPQADPA
jgi:hypothetical protein